MISLSIKCAVIALASAVTVCARAQSALSLQDCMRYAISNSTKVRIQEAACDDARIARRDAALTLFTPQIQAQTYAYYNFGRSIDPQTNTYFNTTSFHNNYEVNAGIELFNGFKAVNNYRISRTGMMIADSQEKQVEADICLAVMEAYYNVVYYKRLTEIYEEQVSVAKQSLVKAKKQEELGQKGHADVLQMEADLMDREYDLINTRNQYESQRMILADLMFWPVEEELVVVTSIPSGDDTLACPADESVVGFAIDHDPGIRIAAFQQVNAKRELSTATWQALPKVSLYAGWGTSYYTYQGSATDIFRNQFLNNGGEYVQLSVSIPIWNRLNRVSEIARKRNEFRRATAELSQKRREVESEVRRAIQDRDGSETAYLQALRKSEVQSEAYQLNLKKLEQGLISPLEFQTATGNYLRSQADEMNSHFQYLIKQAVVKYYSGIEYVNQ